MTIEIAWPLTNTFNATLKTGKWILNSDLIGFQLINIKFYRLARNPFHILHEGGITDKLRMLPDGNQIHKILQLYMTLTTCTVYSGKVFVQDKNIKNNNINLRNNY